MARGCLVAVIRCIFGIQTTPKTTHLAIGLDQPSLVLCKVSYKLRTSMIPYLT